MRTIKSALTRILVVLLPADAFMFDDELSFTGRRLLARLGFLTSAVIVMTVGLAVAARTAWGEVLAGALLGWSTSLMVWSLRSFRSERESIEDKLVAAAELDLLHARLNHLSHALGQPLININEGHLQHVVALRAERIAHFAGLEEFRGASRGQLEDGPDWWTNIGCGYPPDQH